MAKEDEKGKLKKLLDEQRSIEGRQKSLQAEIEKRHKPACTGGGRGAYGGRQGPCGAVYWWGGQGSV